MRPSVRYLLITVLCDCCMPVCDNTKYMPLQCPSGQLCELICDMITDCAWPFWPDFRLLSNLLSFTNTAHDNHESCYEERTLYCMVFNMDQNIYTSVSVHIRSESSNWPPSLTCWWSQPLCCRHECCADPELLLSRERISATARRSPNASSVQSHDTGSVRYWLYDADNVMTNP